jgi:uncharacterized membrane protein YidH (DUF202 family)
VSPRDPGLQPERTALAWQRTSLSAGVVAVLLLRTAVIRGSAFGLAAAACALAMVITAWLMGRRLGARHAPRPVLVAMVAAACTTGALVTVELLLAAR